MKTNASSENVIKAVKTVSSNLYEGNVIFRKEPEHLTKNVIRFTLKTKDSNKPGSMDNNGMKQPKANWQVHQDVVKEIFKLESKPNIYVDTLMGRLYNENPSTEDVKTERELKSSERESSIRGKLKGEKKLSKKQQKVQLNQFLRALKYVFEHKELLEQVESE